MPVPVPDFSTLLGQELRGLKMGIPSNYYFDIIDPEVETAVRQAISTLEALGVEAREVALPSMQYAGALRIAGMADSVVTHEPYLATHRHDYGPTVLYRTLAGQFVLGRDYSKALKVQRLIKEEYARVLQDVDFLVTPAAPVVAWRIDTDTVVLGGTAYPVRGPGAGMTARCTSPSNARVTRYVDSLWVRAPVSLLASSSWGARLRKPACSRWRTRMRPFHRAVIAGRPWLMHDYWRARGMAWGLPVHIEGYHPGTRLKAYIDSHHGGTGSV